MATGSIRGVPTAPHLAGVIRVTPGVTRARVVILIVALSALTAKLVLAAHTYGTEDIHTWTAFADGVRQRGPVGVYGIDFGHTKHLLYNHPPLVGFYLWFINL